MTTSPVSCLPEEGVKDATLTILTAPRQSLADALGLSPDTPLYLVDLRSPVTIRAGRRWVRVRCPR